MADWKELSLAKEVSSSTTEANTVVPASGKEVTVTKFSGHAAYSVNSCVKAVWDYDGTEEIIWSTKGDDTEEIHHTLTGNGSKKLAIVLENGEDGALVMSGKIGYWEQ
jgi:hypothetical protein